MINKLNSKIDEARTAALIGGALDNSYFVKRVDDGFGNSAVEKATDDSAEDIVGISLVSPIAATYRAVVNAPHNMAATFDVQLSYTAVDILSVRVYNVTQAQAETPDSVTVGGLIDLTTAQGAGLLVTDELIISYRRSVTLQDLSVEGFPLDFANQINGSDGAVEFITGNSTVETDYYDTAVAYAIGAKVYVHALGFPTSASGGFEVGTVDHVPTNENPVLGISFDLKF